MENQNNDNQNQEVAANAVGKKEKEKEEKELIYSTRQLEYAIRELSGVRKEWDKAIKNHEINLSETIKKLEQENFTLNKLPEKMGIYLKQIIPDISNHIQEKILKDFEVSLELCNKQLLDLSNKIQDANKKVEIYQNEQIKKRLINLVLNLVLLIAIGSGSSYFISAYLLDKRAPSQVFLRPSGDVNVSNSTVLIEPAGKTNIHDNNKKPRK